MTNGWKKELDVVGIGYRVELKGKDMVVFTLGYSHPIEVPAAHRASLWRSDPKQTHVTVRRVSTVRRSARLLADMRSLRKPDPYKNKGVRYSDEKLKKKVGKTGAK